MAISRQQFCDIEHDRKIVISKLAAKFASILGYYVSQLIRITLQSRVTKQSYKALRTEAVKY